MVEEPLVMIADWLELTVRLLLKGIDCVNDEFEMDDRRLLSIVLALIEGVKEVKLCVAIEPFAVEGSVVLKPAVLEVTVGWNKEDLDSEPGIVDELPAGIELLFENEELKDADPLGELIYDE